MVSKFSALLLMFVGFQAVAGEVVGKVESVSADKSNVVVIADKNVAVDDVLIVGDFCELRVVKIRESKVLTRAESCADSSVLKKGAAVEADGGISRSHNEPRSATAPVYGSPSSPSYNQAPALHSSVSEWSGGLVLNDFSGTVSGHGFSANTTEDTQGIGLNIDYSYISAGNVGFIGGFPLLFKLGGSGWESYTYLRPNANIAFSPSNAFSFFVGANIVKYFSPSSFNDLAVGVGYQIGVFVHATPGTILKVAYVSQKASTTGSGPSYDLELKGIELGLNFVF